MTRRRLLQMGPVELASRSRQKASAWLDRTGWDRYRAGGPERVLREVFSPLSSGAAARSSGGGAQFVLDRFRETGPGRFFAGADSEAVPGLVAERFPNACADTIAAAEAVCLGHFDLLGYRALHFGEPIDWHWDPVSGRRAPLVHWTQLNPLDSQVVGDSKVVWELNRQQWLVRLGQAYRLTGDERYAEAFKRSVQAWLRSNPVGLGINWASSLEVSLRLIAWCWALVLFVRSPHVDADFFLSALWAIHVHASHTARYLSYYFSPNTHLTGEALGLFYAGTLFPELASARRWRELGARILIESVEQQILPDGVHFEQSTWYQRYTVEIYLHLLMLAERNHIRLPDLVRIRVQAMLDFLLAVRRPDGTMPQIGDDDGGYLLVLAGREPNDFRGLFSTAAILFGRSDYAWASESVAPESWWLLGASCRLPGSPAPPVGPTSRLFATGGYAVMRTGWGQTEHQLIFDAGPLGCPVSGAHGHADLLSIQCAVFGVPYIVDPGTCTYRSDGPWRDFFRSTGAHSTITVDGQDQATPAGPFRWRSRPRAQLRHWISTERFDFADAAHAAFGTAAEPIIHRRRVVFVKPRYWVLIDDLDGVAEHQIDLRFQFARLTLTLEPNLWVRAHGRGRGGFLVRALAAVALKADVLDGASEPIQGWTSPQYGRRQPAPLLRYTAVTPLPLRIVSLLLPTLTPDGAPPAISLQGVDTRSPNRLVFDDSGESVSWDEHGSIGLTDANPERVHDLTEPSSRRARGH